MVPKCIASAEGVREKTLTTAVASRMRLVFAGEQRQSGEGVVAVALDHGDCVDADLVGKPGAIEEGLDERRGSTGGSRKVGAWEVLSRLVGGGWQWLAVVGGGWRRGSA